MPRFSFFFLLCETKLVVIESVNAGAGVVAEGGLAGQGSNTTPAHLRSTLMTFYADGFSKTITRMDNF
jgi:hypothetical protein